MPVILSKSTSINLFYNIKHPIGLTKCRVETFWGFQGWGIRIHKNFSESADARGFADIAKNDYNIALILYFELILGTYV